jgi:hypothetical protein
VATLCDIVNGWPASSPGCILRGEDPEPDGEDGPADLRVLRAIEDSLPSGRPQPLASRPRQRFPTRDQAMTLPPIEAPELANAAGPGR